VKPDRHDSKDAKERPLASPCLLSRKFDFLAAVVYTMFTQCNPGSLGIVEEAGGSMATAIVTKWGNGQGIRFPKLVLDEIGIKIGDTVEINRQSDTIIVRKIHTQPQSLGDLFRDYDGGYKPTEWDIGEPEGKEIW
jgi:antitoxin MazE